MDEEREKRNRGFAAMDRERQRAIASEGGRAAHQKGTAHEFNADEARAAGRKGGVAVSGNREHMANIGRRGAEARRISLASRDGAESRANGGMGNGGRDDFREQIAAQGD
ncbi:MAG: KGG domain-containing protein [Gemmatimonadaceae bacterium]